MNTSNPSGTASITGNSRQHRPNTPKEKNYAKQTTAALLATILIAVVAATFLYASPNAEAQEATTLTANTGQTAETGGTSLTSGFPKNAQAFTTGTSETGYALDSIGIHFQIIGSTGTVGSQLKITVTKEASGSPSDEICTLVDPTTFTGQGIQTFTAPLGTPCPILQPNTTYFVMIDRVSISSATISLSATTSDNEDTGGATGWTIANMARTSNGTTWNDEHSSRSRIIEIKGNVYVPPKRVTSFDLHGDNDNPKGVWGNDDTFWVVNDGTGQNNKIYGYRRTDGSRDASKDFDTLNAASNTHPKGICSDGTTVFVADHNDNKLYAYKMADRTRDSAKDINLASGNGNAGGAWCDADTVWVTQDNNGTSSKVFAYKRSDGTHDSAKDLTAAVMSASTNDGGVNNSDPRGMWSNGTTLFVADDEDRKVYGYKLADLTKDDTGDLLLGSANTDAEGMWFDGRMLWVADDGDDRLYHYVLHAAQPDNTRAKGDPAIRSPTNQDIWTAALTVAEHTTGLLGYVTTASPSAGSLSDTSYMRVHNTHVIKDLYLDTNGDLLLAMNFQNPEEFILTADGETFFSPGKGAFIDATTYWYLWPDSGLSWSASDTVSVSISIAKPKVGDVLTADPAGIADADGVENATFQYQWLRAEGDGETLIDGADRRRYVVRPEDAHKYLKVRAVFDDDAGYKEVPIFSDPAGPVDPIVPDAPTDLTAEPAPDTTPQTAVTMSWTESANDRGHAITKQQYRYQVGSAAFGDWTDIADSAPGEANAAGLTLTGLPTDNPPIALTFEVRAVNGNGPGPGSNTASATIDVPDQIASFQVEEDDRQFELSWTTPDNNGSAILRYEYWVTSIEQAGHIIESGTTIPGSDADTTSVTVTGLTNGHTHAIGIRAVNSLGGATHRVQVGIIPGTFPSDPKDLTGEAGDGQATLRWTVPDSVGGIGIAGYQYQQKTGNGAYGSWTDITGSTALTTEHTVTGLTNGTTYSFKVRAKNREGGGPASNEVTVVPASVPTAPQLLTATAGNGKVRLDWNTPASDGGNPITHYELRRKAGNIPVTEWATVPSSNVNTTVHSVTGLHNGTTYIFELRAATATHKGETASVTATPMTETPDAPAVTLGTQDSGLQVSWTVADDGGAPVTEYHVQWKSGSQSFDSSREQTGLTSSSTTITGLTNGTSYDVRVRAMNSAGWSGWSATRSETPRPRPIPTVAITASVSEPVTGPFRVTFTFTDTNNAGDQHYGIEGFEASDIAAWYTSPGTESYEFEVEDFREEAAGRVYSALVDEIIDGKLWIDVPDGAAQSSYDGLKVIGAYETWQVDAPDPPPAPEGAQVWEDTLTIGGKEGDWDAGIMGYFIGWSPNTDKDKRFGALPNANFAYAGVDYEVLELSYTPSWRVVRLAMCPLLDGANRRFELRLDDDYVSFDPDDYQKRDFGRTKDGSRQQCREYDWGKITLDWTYGHTKNVRITR